MTLVVKRMSPAQIAGLAAAFGDAADNDLNVHVDLTGLEDTKLRARRGDHTVIVTARGHVTVVGADGAREPEDTGVDPMSSGAPSGSLG